MKRSIKAALTLSMLFVSAPVLAQSQLEQSAGLTGNQGQGMTLNQIAAVKFNRGVSAQDQQTVVAQQIPGSNPELEAFGLEKYNADQSYSDQILYGDRREITDMAFQGNVDVRRHAQLIATARLSPEEASSMSLNEVQNAYLDRLH